jgi:hypothetical protein
MRRWSTFLRWVMPGLMDAHTDLTLTEIIGAPFERFI